VSIPCPPRALASRSLVPALLLGGAGLWPSQVGAAAASSTVESVTVIGQRERTTVGVGSRLALPAGELPASVHWIARDELLQRGDHSTAQAVARAPGFTTVGMSAFAGSALAARGFTGNASIGQLYDGQRLLVSGGAMSFPVDTWAFERVEVLAGPASVLYGAGTIGGAVNYAPRTIRRDQLALEALAATGSWQTHRLGVAASGPLGAATAFRVNAVRHRSDGYVARNEQARWAASVAVLRDLSPTLTVSGFYDGGRIDDRGYFGTPLIGGRIDPRTRRANFNVEDASTTFDNDWVRARIDWRPRPGLAIRNETYRLTTFRDFRNLENYTWVPATGRVARSFNFGTDIDQAQWGNRLDVTWSGTPGGRPAEIALGIEYTRVDYETLTVTRGGTSVDPYAFTPGRFDPGPGLAPALGTDTVQRSAHAEGTVALGRGWRAVGGVRAERIDLERFNRADGSRVGLAFEPLTWRAGFVGPLGDGVTAYGQYVVGNDAAGSLISLPATNAARLQTGRQVELGLRHSLPAAGLAWSVAAYRITKDDLVSRDPANPNLAQQIGRQSSRGVELATRFEPVRWLRLDLNGSVLEARFDDFNELVAGTLVARAGRVPPNAPERLANLWVTVRPAGRVEFGGGARYVGPRWSNNANTLAIPSYVLVDAYADWRFASDATLSLRVRNVADRDWVVAPYNAGAQWALGDPRAVEVALRWSL